MSKKLFTIVSGLILVSMFLGPCSPKATETPAAETQAPMVTEQPTLAPEKTEEPVVTEAPADDKFTIGISNPFISSEYRTQMIAELIEVNQEYMDAGITN